MTNKSSMLPEAENEYVYNLKSIEEIESYMDISSRTLARWKIKFDWDNKRKRYLKSKNAFHEDLYIFARKLMSNISQDIDSGEKVDNGRMFALFKMLPMLVKVKEYEDVASKTEKDDKPKGMSPEIIREIEESILGIRHDD